MKRWLEKHLKIYSHELSTFAWLAVIFFAIFFVTAIFRNYVDTAFLKRFGPQYIPWMLVINALLTFVVFGVVDRLGRRFTDHFLLSGFLGILAVTVTLLFVMVKVEYSVTVTVLSFKVKVGTSLAYPILYQLLHLLDSILLIYLWNMAGDMFDTRQGKRIFPLVTMSQVLGTTLGSFATRPITMVTGEDFTLIIFSSICLGVALFLGFTGPKMLGNVKPRVPTKKGSDTTTVKLTEVPGLMKRFPIIRYLIVTGLVPNILLPIFFYQFSVIANATFPTEQKLISFLGYFRGSITLTTFVMLMFVGRMYSTMGLTNASLAHPINFTVLFAGLTVWFKIGIACYGQFSVILIQRAIAGPVNKIFFNIIPNELMIWSRTFIRGTVLKVGMLAGSLLMIVLKPIPWLNPQHFSYIAVVFAAWWVIETLFFRKHYKRVLKQVITEKEIDFDQIESVRTFDSGGGAREIGPVSVEDRPEEQASVSVGRKPFMASEVALKLLNDPDPSVRAEAASSFAMNPDIRAVRKLVLCLEETDTHVRNAAIESLMSYGERILPFLESSLIDASPRMRQGILEVMRLSGLKGFEILPFFAKEVAQAYTNLITLRRLEPLKESTSVLFLKQHLREMIDEILRLIFYALWVYHADMRLIYNALKSESASIAVELVENSIDKDIAPYLIPLIEDVPIDEKIENGRKLLPLVRNDNLDRLLTMLAESDNPVTRMLALFVIGEQLPDQNFIPVVESRLEDPDAPVRELAQFAMARINSEEAPMPEAIELINKLKTFPLFEDLGFRELYAIATVVTLEHFKPNDLIIVEGEDNSSIYMIVSGQVRILTDYGTENEKEKVVIGDGSFMGELSMFTRQPPNATCMAKETTEALVLPHHQFIEIMRVYPQIGINLCKFFSNKLRQAVY